MLFFNVIESIVSDEMYYYFVDCDTHKCIYEGFELPENARDFLLTSIEGGESEHGCYLWFEGSFYNGN